MPLPKFAHFIKCAVFKHRRHALGDFFAKGRAVGQKTNPGASKGWQDLDRRLGLPMGKRLACAQIDFEGTLVALTVARFEIVGGLRITLDKLLSNGCGLKRGNFGFDRGIDWRNGSHTFNDSAKIQACAAHKYERFGRLAHHEIQLFKPKLCVHRLIGGHKAEQMMRYLCSLCLGWNSGENR